MHKRITLNQRQDKLQSDRGRVAGVSAGSRCREGLVNHAHALPRNHAPSVMHYKAVGEMGA